MAKFVVAASVDDASLLHKRNASFTYRIVDNNNYVIDQYGGVTAKLGYDPQKGDTFTVEVAYKNGNQKVSKTRKTFTVKI